MTALDNTSIIGAHYGQPSSDALQILSDYDKAFGRAGHSAMHGTPNSLYVEDLTVAAAVNAATVSGMVKKAPWPFKIWRADVGCESAAGSAATVDVQVDPAGGTSFTSIFAAAVDVKTGAGTDVPTAPLAAVASNEIPYGATYKIVVIGTGSGAVVGAHAKLICQHL